MSGRHRKPTTSSIGVAKIAVTGAVIGGGAIGLSAQAQAASDSEWDVVASCESSGNWAINTGNGYQGGLQFSPSTWLGYGGGQFASAANLASRDQQIAIAEKVLAGQGKGAWPVCGRGLSGATPRTVTPAAVKAHTEQPAQPAPPADAPVDAPAPAATQDDAAPQELPAPAPQDAAPAPQELPAPAPQDAAPAPQDGAPQDLPAPAQDGQPKDAPAPAPEIVSTADIAPVPDQIVDGAAPVGATIVQAGLITPAPMAPADPAVPPVVPATPVTVVPAAAPTTLVPAAPAPAADPAAPATPGADTTIVASGQLPNGVQHLPSPDSPPPGTSTDPGQAGNPNVSYLKELWHALQNQDIDRNDLILALAQRSFTGQVPAGAQTPGGAPVAGAPVAGAPAVGAPAPAPADAPVLVDAPPAA